MAGTMKQFCMKIDLFKLAATNSHKFIFVKQTNEPIHEKEHVNISDTAKFQSSGPNAGEMADI